MGLAYGFEEAGNNRVEWRPMRTNKTYYAGQVLSLSTMGSVYTAMTAATGVYGILLADTTTTASEKTTKVPVSVFAPGALFRVRVSTTASERSVGTLADFTINTTSKYRLNVAAIAQRTFSVIRMDSRDTATAARRVIVSVAPQKSRYMGLGTRG